MNPKPPRVDSRREKRKTVTLIAGLVCNESIVFATDSEESGGYRKSSIQKMLHAPLDNYENLVAIHANRPPLTAVVVAGAGNGTLADFAMQRITQQVKKATNHADAIEIVENILVKIFDVNIPRHPVADPLDAEFKLLIGIKAPDDEKPILYSTEGVTVVRRDRYFTWGSGSVTDYILDQLYSDYMTTEDGIAAMVYMLQIAKQYVAGVGGASQLLLLHSSGRIDKKVSWEVSEEENIAKQFTSLTGFLLLSLMRTRTGDEADFQTTLADFTEAIKQMRERKKTSDQTLDEMMALLDPDATERESPE
jgi:20S proteasome alpha/beta subunit